MSTYQIGIIVVLGLGIYLVGKGLKKVLGVVLALYLAYLVAGYLGMI